MWKITLKGNWSFCFVLAKSDALEGNGKEAGELDMQFYQNGTEQESVLKILILGSTSYVWCQDEILELGHNDIFQNPDVFRGLAKKQID